mmetsp:Transcript_40006/g.94034  ORF Transcript_40006/g.94034 Transcript_40006/m.94034 type:complete len:263 (-) Transcript_40006:854-1642(-)
MVKRGRICVARFPLLPVVVIVVAVAPAAPAPAVLHRNFAPHVHPVPRFREHLQGRRSRGVQFERHGSARACESEGCFSRVNLDGAVFILDGPADISTRIRAISCEQQTVFAVHNDARICLVRSNEGSDRSRRDAHLRDEDPHGVLGFGLRTIRLTHKQLETVRAVRGCQGACWNRESRRSLATQIWAHSRLVLVLVILVLSISLASLFLGDSALPFVHEILILFWQKVFVKRQRAIQSKFFMCRDELLAPAFNEGEDISPCR